MFESNGRDEFVDATICGDCIDVLKNMRDDSIDIVLTSPPYNLGIDYGEYKDDMEIDEYYKWCGVWIKELYRVLRHSGRFLLVHYLSCGRSEKRFAPLMRLNCIAEDCGFKHHGMAIWWDITISRLTAWGSWLSSSAPYINSPFEGIDILYKGAWKRDGQKDELTKEEFMMGCSGIWKIAPEKNRLHPAPFPEKLAELAIKLFSKKGDIVLDPFAGSGTTGVICKRLDRHYVLIEKEKKWVEMIEDRLSKTE